MSVRSLIARVSTIESNVDTLQSKADSENAVLTGTTSINGLVLLNGPVSLTSTIHGITKSMVGLGNGNNNSDKDNNYRMKLRQCLKPSQEHLIK